MARPGLGGIGGDFVPANTAGVLVYRVIIDVVCAEKVGFAVAIDVGAHLVVNPVGVEQGADVIGAGKPLVVACAFTLVNKKGSSAESVGEKRASWGFAPDPRILEASQDK